MDASKQEGAGGEIPRDLAEARQRLADSIGSLINEVHPKAVAHRTIDDAKATAQRTFDEAKATAQTRFDDAKTAAQRTFEEVKATAGEKMQQLKAELKDDNGWRADRIVAIAGGVLGVLTFVGIVRGVRR